MIVHEFDKDYWEQHWVLTDSSWKRSQGSANPYIVNETRHLTPGSALDAGCGTEAIWLAHNNWRVTGADISPTALIVVADQAGEAAVEDQITWVETDLTTWDPSERWGLVVTNYSHPSIPQVNFYQRTSGWVVRGGTLLVAGHLHDPGEATSHYPRGAAADLHEITDLFTSPAWEIETARRDTRLITRPDGEVTSLSDVIVHARRIR